MKHKWYNEIVAFANGIDIEVKHQGYEWEKADNLIYIDNDKVQYRIKPQPKEPKYLYAYIINNEVELDLMPNLNYKYIGKIEVQDD